MSNFDRKNTGESASRIMDHRAAATTSFWTTIDDLTEVPFPTIVEFATDLQRETVRAKLLIAARLQSRCSFVEGSCASSIFAKLEISFTV